jgi:hypothetical protein
MKTVIAAALVVVAVLLTSAVWYIAIGNPHFTQNTRPTATPYSTPTLTPSPTLSPTPTLVPAAHVTAEINAIPSYELPNYTPNSGDYLLINGTVTNNSPNIAYNVGLKVTATEATLTHTGNAIDMVVPITSATYGQTSASEIVYAPLSTLLPYQSIPIVIEINPYAPSETPTLNNINVTVVWSNMS